MFAIGQVCVHIKYVSTGKAYWLDSIIIIIIIIIITHDPRPLPNTHDPRHLATQFHCLDLDLVIG